jgi:hypothetical protein
VRTWKLLAIAGLLYGCAHAAQYRPTPADREWESTLGTAQQLAANARYASADSVLADFVQRQPGTAGAREAVFWRGVFALEPANSAASVHGARTAFETYLADSGTLTHRAEARALGRAASVIDSLFQVRTDSIPAVHLVVGEDSLRDTAREQEMLKNLKRLQDSLDKTTAELDRIKKRLSTGKP